MTDATKRHGLDATAELGVAALPVSGRTPSRRVKSITLAQLGTSRRNSQKRISPGKRYMETMYGGSPI